jgi:phosphoribosylamine---glycine ligase
MFWSKPNKVFNETIKRMESRLAESGYVGYFDLNCIVNEEGVHPLEFTSRFGYPTISIQQEGIINTIDEFLYGLVNKEFKEFKTKKGFQIGVCIFVPPYPFNDKELFEVKSRGSVIYFKDSKNNHKDDSDHKDDSGPSEKDIEGVHTLEVKKVGCEWVVSGTEGWPLIVCGSGDTIEQAKKMAYGRIKNIMIPNMYYRVDIGDKWAEENKKLKTWGYLDEMKLDDRDVKRLIVR